MNIAEIKPTDIANGPGVRVSVFVSGCTHRCPGCFNEVAWDFSYGTPFTDDTLAFIRRLLAPKHIKGLTILGGEPMHLYNQPGVLSIIKSVKNAYPDKSIWLYTGYKLEDLVHDKALFYIGEEILKRIDVLVDGPFVQDLKDLSLRFRGSSNQRIIDMNASRETDKIELWWSKDSPIEIPPLSISKRRN